MENQYKNNSVGHKNGCSCVLSKSSQSYGQTLDEMEFERGIWQAALDDNVDKLFHLLENGEDPSKTDPSGYTALHYASRNGNIRSVEILLDHGACVDSITRSGKDTPLHRAAYCGHVAIVKLLLNYKADASAYNTDGMTPYHKAIVGNQLHIAKILKQHLPAVISIKDNKGRTGDDLLHQS